MFAAVPQTEEPLIQLPAAPDLEPQPAQSLGLDPVWPDWRTRKSAWICGRRRLDGSDTGCVFCGDPKFWNGVRRRDTWRAWSRCGGACAPSGSPLWRRRCCTYDSWKASDLNKKQRGCYVRQTENESLLFKNPRVHQLAFAIIRFLCVLSVSSKSRLIFDQHVNFESWI